MFSDIHPDEVVGCGIFDVVVILDAEGETEITIWETVEEFSEVFVEEIFGEVLGRAEVRFFFWPVTSGEDIGAVVLKESVISECNAVFEEIVLESEDKFIALFVETGSKIWVTHDALNEVVSFAGGKLGQNGCYHRLVAVYSGIGEERIEVVVVKGF